MTGITIISQGYAPGLAGADLMAWGTARELAARGHRVAMLGTVAGRPHDAPPGVPDAAGVTILDWRDVRDQVSPLPWLPDVLHAFDLGRPEPHEFAAALAARLRIPFVVTPATAREAWPDQGAAAASLRAAALVLALTGAEASRLREHVRDDGLVWTVGQATDLPVVTDPAALRLRLGGTGPVVLFLGRRASFKGLAVLLAAAELLRPSVPSLQVVLAGPGGPPVRAKGVTDLGMVSEADKANALAGCDVLCLPSHAEVFPLAFIEAWSLGKPVVSGDFAGAREVVRDGGLVVPADADSVAAGLASLLRDPARLAAAGEAGLQRVRCELTWQTLIPRIEQAYRSARQGAPPR